MEQKILTIGKQKFKYWEHLGFVEFPSLTRIPFLSKNEGSPNLMAITKFEEMGYEFVSEAFSYLIFKKK